MLTTLFNTGLRSCSSKMYRFVYPFIHLNTHTSVHLFVHSANIYWMPTMCIVPELWRQPLEAHSLMQETGMTQVLYNMMSDVPEEFSARMNWEKNRWRWDVSWKDSGNIPQSSPLKYLLFLPHDNWGWLPLCHTQEKNFPLGFLIDNQQTRNTSRLPEHEDSPVAATHCWCDLRQSLPLSGPQFLHL